MRAWIPVKKVDLESLEERLPLNRKLVVSWMPNVGAVYMIVNCAKPHYKTKKPKVIY